MFYSNAPMIHFDALIHLDLNNIYHFLFSTKLYTSALHIRVLPIDRSFQRIYDIFVLLSPWTRLWAGNVHGIRPLGAEWNWRCWS